MVYLIIIPVKLILRQTAILSLIPRSFHWCKEYLTLQPVSPTRWFPLMIISDLTL